MAVPLNEYIFKLKKSIDGMNQKLLTEITGQGKAADNMVVQILKRVRDKGEAFDGSGFKPYSTKPMLTGSSAFLNKSNAKKFFKKEKVTRQQQYDSLSGKAPTTNISEFEETGWRTVKGRHLKILVGGYKEFRRLNDRANNKKEQVFEFSGAMWKDFRVQGKKVDGDGWIEIEQGLSKDGEKKKLEGNVEREGKPIIRPNKKELDEFMITVGKEAMKILDVK